LSGAVLIGLGNRMRGDDAVGPEVARRLAASGIDARVVEHEAEPTGLIELWADSELAVVVDALAPAGSPGRVERHEVGSGGLAPEHARPASTHALDLPATIELARSLGRLPDRLVVFGVEAAGFETGAPISAAVARALPAAVERVAAELERAAKPRL
jgi:hydrogenase maturation protease